MFNDISILPAPDLLKRIYDNCVVGNVLYYLPGDSGYSNKCGLIAPYPKTTAMTRGEREFDRAMSKVRVTVEWGFGHIRQLWPLLDREHALKLGSMPVGALYLSATLLTNFHVCLYGADISVYFGAPDPDVEDYLS